MSVILVAEQDAGFAVSITEHLTAEGWTVHRVNGRDAAFQAATTMKPGLLLASASLPDAKDLLAAFSRRRGGPGAVVMVPAPQASQVSAADFEADVLLAKPFSDVDLKKTVRACLAQAAQATSRPSPEGIQASGQQLTSADIFGDVLAEVEAEATRARRAASKARKKTSKDEIERKLEETLSGVLLPDLKPRRPSEPSTAPPQAAAAGTATSRPRRKEELPTEREIDDLLDKTLSSLELPTRARKAAQKPAAPKPAAPQPAAPQPATPATPSAPAASLPDLSPPPAFEPPPSFQALPALERKDSAPSAPKANPFAPEPTAAALTPPASETLPAPQPTPAFDVPPLEGSGPAVSAPESAPAFDAPSDDLLPSIDVALPDESSASTPPLGDIPGGTFEPLVSDGATAEADPWASPPALSSPPAEGAAVEPTVGRTSGAFAVDGDDPWRDLRGLSAPTSFDDTGTDAGAFTLKDEESTSDPWKATSPDDLFPASFSGTDGASSPAPDAPPSPLPPAVAEPFEPPTPSPMPSIGSSSFEPAPSTSPVSEAQLAEPAMPTPPALSGDAFATMPSAAPVPSAPPSAEANAASPESAPAGSEASNPLERFRSFLDQVDDSAPAAPQGTEAASPEPMLGTGAFTPPPFGAGSLDAGDLDPKAVDAAGTDTGSFVTGTGAFTPPPIETGGDTGSFVTGTGAFTPPPIETGGDTGSFITGTGAFTPPPIETGGDTGSFVTGTGAFTPPPIETGGDTGSFVTGTGSFTPPPFEIDSGDSGASETGSFVTGTGAFVPPATDTSSFTPPVDPTSAAPDAGAADALQGVLELRGGDESTSVNEVSGGQPFGDYTLLERIAVGGMAEVWRARRSGVEGFQKTVAIKKILSHLTDSTDFIDMFIDEAKLAAQLTHNHIIQIYDLGKVEDDYFIAMEFVDGKDLRTILKKSAAQDRPLPLNLALMIVAALARALDYAHRKKGFDDRALGLVHRDVSPQNVLISYEGEIKLCDFGIVKAVAKASTTQMGALKGKLQYMSPEQAWGKSVDSRSDIFSLGSVLFEVLSGEKLFTGDSEIGVLDAVRECRVRSLVEMLPDLPPAVDRIVAKALEQDPANRYATAGDMDNDIQDVLRDLQPGADSKDLSAYMASLFQPSLEAPSFEPVGDGSAVYIPSVPGEAPVLDAASAPQDSPADLPVEGAPAPPASQSDEAASKGGRNKLLLGVVAVVVLVATAAFFFMQSKSADPAPAPSSSPSVTAPTTPAETTAGDPAEGGGTAEGSAQDEATQDEPGAQSDAVAGEDSEAQTGADATDGTAPDALDIEALINEGLDAQQSELKERLESEYEAKRRELEEKLAEAQKDNEPSEPPPDEN